MVGILFGVWIIFSWFYSGWSSNISYGDIGYDLTDYETGVEEEGSGDTAFYAFGGEFFTNKVEWLDNNQNQYKAVFKVHEEYLEPSTKYRERIRSNASWTNLYGGLAQFDEGKLDEILEMFEDIKEENDLSQKEFADMVVTSIQNISYVLVHQYSHAKADRLWGGFYEEYHESGEACLENIKFGIQSPVEFMSNFKGDCDTRALLCYLILKDFGFDVAMLGSEEYGHEVLGISGNYRGSFLKKDGIKYYAWETTAVGYSPGVMSSDCSDMDYWTIDLCSRD
ncbi:MAG: hypothetical protein ACI857_001950 [Arenicella sp.]